MQITSRKGLPLSNTKSEGLSVEETAAILIDTYKEYRGINRISESGSTVFVKIALWYENDAFFDPKLFIKCGFDLEWDRGHPLPFDYYKKRVKKLYDHESSCGKSGKSLKERYISEFSDAFDKLNKLKLIRGEVTVRDIRGYAISKLIPDSVLALFPGYLSFTELEEEERLLEVKAKLQSLELYNPFRDKLREAGIL